MPSQQVDLIYFILFFKYNKQASIFYIDQIMFVSRMNKMNKHELNSKGKPKKGITLSNSLSSQQLQISIRHIEPSIVQQIKKKTVTCPVCFGDYEQTQMKLFGNCMHSFCGGCIQYRINVEIKTKKPIKCMMAQCAQILASYSPLIQTLTPSIIKQYANVMKLYNNPNLRKCPTQQCEDFFNIKNKEVRCKSCQTKFCGSCLHPYNNGICLCLQANKIKQKFGYQRCKCNQIIERIEGCNLMTCECGYQFCYRCGKQWTSNHDCISTKKAILLSIILVFVSILSLQVIYSTILSLIIPFSILIGVFLSSFIWAFKIMKDDYTCKQIILFNIILYFICWAKAFCRNSQIIGKYYRKIRLQKLPLFPISSFVERKLLPYFIQN